VFGIDDVWGCDLVEMQEWNYQNKGFRYMLNVIDVCSKFAWSVPLKDKKGLTVVQAFKQIVEKSARIPKHIWVDQGKEFYNKNMNEWLKENNIIRYSTFGEHKSAVVERFNRTLKEIMWKRFTAKNTRKWIDTLDQLLHDYNNRIHSTTGMTPVKASLKENETKVLQNIINRSKARRRTFSTKPKFKVGDKVRMSRTKALFEKGYLPNWSEEVYTIEKVQKTTPITYIIKDSLGEVIQGNVYNEELQKSNQEIYRIEKVIRKKKIDGVEHALVKWSGYSNKHNQWMPVSDLEKVS
jgi:hypothetical protein